MPEPGGLDSRIQFVVEHTEVLRNPKQKLATFGTTRLSYFLVTEPVYEELLQGVQETVLRRGKVSAERPRIVTPFYLRNLFQGFEHSREYLEYLLRKFGAQQSALLYEYKNELEETSIISNNAQEVVARLNEMLDRESDPLAAIIKGVDEMWDVSLMKFIHDFTGISLKDNVMELAARGLLDMDSSGVPREARLRIEELFRYVQKGELSPSDLKLELDRWGLFREYEDRFLGLFRR